MLLLFSALYCNPSTGVIAGAKLTGSAGLPLIVLIANASLCEEGRCSVILSLPKDDKGG